MAFNIEENGELKDVSLDYYIQDVLKVSPDSCLGNLAKDWAEAYPGQEPQIGFGLTGKPLAVTLLADYVKIFGDICKIRYSKRRGYKGIVKKDGRKIRWF
jgi:hypothetical protein